MKNLGNISPAPGSNHKKKRKGRGPASGNGKTAGKGHKGQKARKGSGPPVGFEGGQTPLYRRIPKHGFTNRRNMQKFHLVRTSQLNLCEEGALVDKELLVKQGIIKKLKHPVKLLVNGELERKVSVNLDKVTAGARKAVESVGGSIQEK